MALSDDHIVERVKRGRVAEYEKLVDRYKRRVYAIAFRMTRNHSDADDIAQETFIKAYRNIARFRGKSGFYTWLYRILVNCCKDHLRKRKRRGELMLADTRDEESGTDALSRVGTPPEALAEAGAAELRGAVSEALESLSVNHRTALILHEFERMPHRDIARVMGCSEGTVRSRLHYARDNMRRKLRHFISRK